MRHLKTANHRRRTPSGVRGLKYLWDEQVYTFDLSHPVRGAWIEMIIDGGGSGDDNVAPRQGCVD